MCVYTYAESAIRLRMDEVIIKFAVVGVLSDIFFMTGAVHISGVADSDRPIVGSVFVTGSDFSENEANGPGGMLLY